MAVLLVAIGHAGIGMVSGGYVGVDVFFVLSGFFITGLLVAEAERSGAIRFRNFYIRRAKRILPAAALTLVVTDVAAYKLLNLVRAKAVMADSIWAALFGANFRFAREGTNYFAQAQLPSPIQHYWSLAVEEQFYLVWPALLSVMLFGLIRLIVRGRRPSRRRALDQRRLIATCCLVFAASLAWSVHDTSAAPAAAYFSPFTRAWELALGALLVAAAPMLGRLPRSLRSAAGGAGVVAIGIAAVTFNSATAYPGWAALLPTLGAAMVITAGLGSEHAALTATSRALANRPLRYVGDRSYSFYLWHWPVLMIAAQYEGHNLSTPTNLALLVVAFGISVVTYACFENPLRHRSWSSTSAGLLAYASIGSALAVAIYLGGSAKQEAQLLGDTAAGAPSQFEPISAASFGSELNAIGASGEPSLRIVKTSVAEAAQRLNVSRLAPPVASVPSDIYAFPHHCAAFDGETRSSVCRLADTESSRTLLVFGDSHAEQWMPAVLALASRQGWAVIPIVKVACAPLDWDRGTGTPDCRSWFKWALSTARGLHPTMLLVAGHYSDEGVDNETRAAQGMQKVVSAVKPQSGAIALVDTPIQKDQPVDCLLRRGATRGRCSTTIDEVSASADAAAADILTRAAGIGVVDPRPWLCANDVCPVVIGNTIAYSDAGHLSSTYVSQLDQVFRIAFLNALRKA